MAFKLQEAKKSVWFHVIIIIALFFVVYFLFFASLGWITDHGEQVKVPDVINKDVRAAVQDLEKRGFEVEVDSSFDLKKNPFAVLVQMPDAESVVKSGRTIFLTVNQAKPPAASMPNLVGLSYRSALMVLKSNKLLLGDTTYKPDYAKGTILEQSYKGRAINEGDDVPQGSRIDLVIADGLSNVVLKVPDVEGLTYEIGNAILNGNGLQVFRSWEGQITDSNNAVIFRQSPAAFNEFGEPNKINEGDVIDIWMKQEADTKTPKNELGSQGGFN